MSRSVPSEWSAKDYGGCLQTVRERRDAAVAKASRRNGHTNVIARMPCTKNEPSILRGARLKRAANVALKPTHRLRTKAAWVDVPAADWRAALRARLW